MANSALATRLGASNDTVLVVVSGLPAVGKSTLVAELAPRLGAVALSRDQARVTTRRTGRLVDSVTFRLLHRRLRGVQRRAGRVLSAEIERCLAAGESVTVEAVAEAPLRRELQRLAQRHRAQFLYVECICTDEREYARRLARRPAFWQSVVARIAARHESPADCLTVDTAEAPSQAASRIVAQLRR